MRKIIEMRYTKLEYSYNAAREKLVYELSVGYDVLRVITGNDFFEDESVNYVHTKWYAPITAIEKIEALIKTQITLEACITKEVTDKLESLFE